MGDGNGEGARACGALVLRGGNRRPVQRSVTRSNAFTAAKRDTFIEVLTATCNVVLAVEASGIANTTAYRMRLRDADFAARWDAALASGYDRLEAEALRYALERLPTAAAAETGSGVDPHGVDPHGGGSSEAAAAVIARSPAAAVVERRASDADLRFVLAILNRYAGAARGNRAARQPRASEAETDARLTTLLDTLARQMSR